MEYQQIIITLLVMLPCVFALIKMSRSRKQDGDEIRELSLLHSEAVQRFKMKKLEVEACEREISRINAELRELIEDEKGGE